VFIYFHKFATILTHICLNMNIAFIHFKLCFSNISSRLTFILACRHAIVTCTASDRSCCTFDVRVKQSSIYILVEKLLLNCEVDSHAPTAKSCAVSLFSSLVHEFISYYVCSNQTSLAQLKQDYYPRGYAMLSSHF
jgi:hypothetical protein